MLPVGEHTWQTLKSFCNYEDNMLVSCHELLLEYARANFKGIPEEAAEDDVLHGIQEVAEKARVFPLLNLLKRGSAAYNEARAVTS